MLDEGVRQINVFAIQLNLLNSDILLAVVHSYNL